MTKLFTLGNSTANSIPCLEDCDSATVLEQDVCTPQPASPAPTMPTSIGNVTDLRASRLPSLLACVEEMR
ncbi:hypothetical protein LTR37_006708 [Vermiconidia calcicola]|uniref:Uncharacterized protein n=1 Tax=Vermiconidia calcicola TaxID=1690605 RepID=A0ACC3NG43_9PEZI|nr:hypothetical protein LTR37_006708 [Vermiconidia calcicola]